MSWPLSIWTKFGSMVKPHGDEWKKEFQKMMLRFLNPEYFPEDILKGSFTSYDKS